MLNILAESEDMCRQFNKTLTFGAFGFASGSHQFDVLKNMHLAALRAGVKNSFFEQGIDSRVIRKTLTLLSKSLSATMLTLSTLVPQESYTKKPIRMGLLQNETNDMQDDVSPADWNICLKGVQRKIFDRVWEEGARRRFKLVDLADKNAKGIAI